MWNAYINVSIVVSLTNACNGQSENMTNQKIWRGTNFRAESQIIRYIKALPSQRYLTESGCVYIE